MKLRIYTNGKKVIYVYIYTEDEQKIKVPEYLEGYKYIEIKDKKEIKKCVALKRQNLIEQIYFKDNVLHLKNLVVDHAWVQQLMPDWLIKKKHTQRLARKIDAELALPTPDILKLLKLRRSAEKMNDWTKKDVYLQALKNMDEDGLKKPVIRQKIKEILKQEGVTLDAEPNNNDTTPANA